MKRASLVWLALASSLPLGACDAVVGAGSRKLDITVVCDSKGCSCAKGFGDCDKDKDNGCETKLDDPMHCGACDNACANGKCDAATLACACDGDFADCDGDPKTVCETNLKTTDAHCGSCERNCQGTGCEDSRCKIQSVTSPGMYGFALIDDKIYYAPAMGLMRVDPNGGAPESLGDPMLYVDLITADKDTVYFSAFPNIYSVPKSGGPTSTLVVKDQDPGRRMGVIGNKLYWENFGDMGKSLALHRAPTTPNGPVEEVTKFGDAMFGYDFALTDKLVYWTQITDIYTSPHDSIAPMKLVTVLEAAPAYFWLEGENMFFSGSPSGTYVMPLKGGDRTKLADRPGYGSVITDATNVYFTSFESGKSPSLWRVAKTGGDPVKLAEDPYGAFYIQIYVDDKWVYWLSGINGPVVRVAK